jgi:hypothetical protein
MFDLSHIHCSLPIVGGGVQTGSTRHRGHLLSYCACPGWLWGWRIIRWNENWQGKPKYLEKTCPTATLSTTNPTWPDPGSNPGRRGGKPATNRLSYGAAYRTLLWYILWCSLTIPTEIFPAYPFPLIVYRTWQRSEKLWKFIRDFDSELVTCSSSHRIAGKVLTTI